MTYSTDMIASTAFQEIAPIGEISESREMRPSSAAEVGEEAELTFRNESDLRVKAPKVYDALLMAFAFRSSREMQKSNNRISQALRDHRRA